MAAGSIKGKDFRRPSHWTHQRTKQSRRDYRSKWILKAMMHSRARSMRWEKQQACLSVASVSTSQHHPSPNRLPSCLSDHHRSSAQNFTERKTDNDACKLETQKLNNRKDKKIQTKIANDQIVETHNSLNTKGLVGSARRFSAGQKVQRPYRARRWWHHIVPGDESSNIGLF